MRHRVVRAPSARPLPGPPAWTGLCPPPSASGSAQPLGDQRWIELRIPGADTRLVLYTPPGQEDRVGTPSNVVFASDDVQATFRELAGRGVKFVAEPEEQPWGTFATFSDPDGNEFVISSRH
ncbi:MAG: VOC family protein [Gemmatimonadetes bacterium]|nr:VOC family protein [Gemmatimonadota bacterium]